MVDDQPRDVGAASREEIVGGPVGAPLARFVAQQDDLVAVVSEPVPDALDHGPPGSFGQPLVVDPVH
jgi:hypothetical protein